MPERPNRARKLRNDTQEIAQNFWYLFYGGAAMIDLGEYTRGSQIRF
jgi:hypothetical protein